MKRLLFFLIVLFLLFLPIPAVHAEEGPETGYWKLNVTEVNKNDSVTEGMVQANPNIVGHNYEIHPGGGSMSTTVKNGDADVTIASSHAFDVPQVLVPGQKATISIAVADAGSSSSNLYISHSTSAGAWINNSGSWQPYGELLTAATGTFVTAENPDKSMMEAKKTTEFTVPGKADGFTVHFSIMGGSAPGPMVINYDYIYVEGVPASETSASELSPTASISPAGSETATQGPSSSPDEPRGPSLTDFENYIDYLAAAGMLDTVDEDAGCRFADLSGQVEVFTVDKEDPEGGYWELANIDNVLRPGMRIRTGRNSSAVLSFNTMSTFVMKPRTEIILTSQFHNKNKLILAAGNIWANIKKMVKDGSMEIEMSQGGGAVKGTIFVCEEDGKNSTLKVIEGKVSFTDKATGKETTVSSGQMIAAGEDAAQPQEFDIREEHAGWITYAPGLAITNKSNTIWFIAAGGGALLIVAAIIFIILRRKKTVRSGYNFAQSNMPYMGNAVTNAAVNFCGRCGNRIEAGTSFCSKCGNKVE